MAGNIHAALLVAVVVVTFTLCARYRMRPTLRRCVWGILAAVVSAALTSGLGIHMCKMGYPVSQWALPAVCTAAALLFIKPATVRRSVVFGAVIFGAGLTSHYVFVVHEPDWIGVPAVDGQDLGKIEAQWHTPLTGLYRRLR